MTISGTGILWIVNRFLASLVRLDSFDVSSRRIRPRSICSRDCPSIISQIDSNEYPDCRTPRFSADPFDFTPRYIYIYFRSVERVDSRKEKEKEFFIFVHFVFEDGKFKRRYVFFQLKIATDEYSFRFGKSINSQGFVVGKAWMRSNEGCRIQSKSSRPRAKTRPSHPRFSSTLPPSLSLSFSTNRKISKYPPSNFLKQRYLVRSTRLRSDRKRADSRYLRKAPRLDPRPDSWKYVETRRARFASVIIAVLVTARVSLSRPPSARPIGRTRRMSCNQDTR